MVNDSLAHKLLASLEFKNCCDPYCQKLIFSYIFETDVYQENTYYNNGARLSTRIIPVVCFSNHKNEIKLEKWNKTRNHLRMESHKLQRTFIL